MWIFLTASGSQTVSSNKDILYDVMPFVNLSHVTCISNVSVDVEIFWVQSLLVNVPNCSELCIPSIFKLT